MTPIAKFILDQLMMKPSKRKDSIRTFEKHLKMMLENVHFFECSKIISLSDELSEKIGAYNHNDIVEFFGPYLFMPAPKCWIEVEDFKGIGPLAFFVETVNKVMGLDQAQVVMIVPERNFNEINLFPLGIIRQDSAIGIDAAGRETFLKQRRDGNENEVTIMMQGWLFTVQNFLFLINQPRIIGKVVHPVHKGLAKNWKATGARYPLQGWTEIKLEVSKPPEIDDGEPHQAHLTGHRALHFVRKFIRIRRGKMEYVSSHWRGDPNLGIKQKRYIVTP